MPVITSQRLTTSAGSSYLPTSSSSYQRRYTDSTDSLNRLNTTASRSTYQTTTFRSTSGYRSAIGNDDTTSATGISSSSNRFGVSKFPRKPPIGSSRIRSENHIRDKSLDRLDRGYSGSGSTKSEPNSSYKRYNSSSLASSVATSGADFYEKYSPANYLQKRELSRSRSLSETGSAIAGGASSNLVDRSSSGYRCISKDRESSIDSTAAIINKVKVCALPAPYSSSSAQLSSGYYTNSNNNNNINNNLSDSCVLSATVTNQKTNNNNNNNNNKALNLTTTTTTGVSSRTATTNNHSTIRSSTVGACLISNGPNGTVTGKKANASTTVTSTLYSKDRQLNAVNIMFNPNNNPTEKSEFLKRTGVKPIVDKNLLGPEVEQTKNSLAKLNKIGKESTVKSSKVTVVDTDKKSTNAKLTQQQLKSTKTIGTNGIITNCQKEDLQNNNMNCFEKSSELLDDIKYIDSDEGDHRKHSPTGTATSTTRTINVTTVGNGEYLNGSTATLPVAASKKTIDLDTNKYNTINNPKSCHQNGIQINVATNEIKTAKVSPLNIDIGTTTSSPIKKEVSGTKGKVAADSNGSVRSTSIRNGLPPTSTRYWDRDRDNARSTTLGTTSSNRLTDTDTYTKSITSSGIGSRSSSDETEGLCGLRNIGNTCFMNSVIQCLSHTNDLTKFLKNNTDTRSVTKDQRILSEFSKLIRDMWTPSTRSVTPSELKSAFSSKHRMYSGYAQQDAQEFLRFFLDSLHSACNNGTKGEQLVIDDNLSDNRKADLTWEWYSKIENSMVKDLFVGQLKSTLKCTVCGHMSVTFDPFWDLSVPLPDSSYCKLEACLDLFIKEEVLDGDEMPTCAKCKTRRKSTKTFMIQRFPKYLVIHLKRFSETRWSKLSNIVELPTGERELNMAPYSASPTSVSYSLYGIANHMGSTAGGHYVALCKHPVLRKWHEFNDNIVSEASESSLVSSSAYLLFYERATNITNFHSAHHRHNTMINDSSKQNSNNNNNNNIYNNYNNCSLATSCNMQNNKSVTVSNASNAINMNITFNNNSQMANYTSNSINIKMNSAEFVYHSVLGIIFYLICIIFYLFCYQ